MSTNEKGSNGSVELSNFPLLIPKEATTDVNPSSSGKSKLIESSPKKTNYYERVPTSENSLLEPNDRPVSASLPSEPLSWREARTRMRGILENYMNDSSFWHSSNTDPSERGSEEYQKPGLCKILFWLSSHNMDCYCGSILFSVVMMGMSIYFFINGDDNDNDNDNDENRNQNVKFTLDMHKSNLIASIIFTIISLLSTWAMNRRRQKSTYDVNLKKKRNVSSLLQVLNKLEEAHDQMDNFPHMKIEPRLNDPNDLRLPGNALSDIYSVYRLSSATGERAVGQWHSVPSLMLAKGDFIALQTGDTAPADCKMVTGSRFGSLTASVNTNLGNRKLPPRGAMIIKSGEKVRPSLRLGKDQPRTSTQSSIPGFPPGKSYLPQNSRKLLHLCNNKRVFEVLEAPMSKFLKSKTVSYQSPQIHRKMCEIRNLMYLLSFAMFTLTFIAVIGRHGIIATHNSQNYYLPFLAALSILPVVTPLVLFIQEIIGTTIILQFVQPLSSRTTCGGHDSHRNETISEKPVMVFFRYIKFGFRSRFSLTDDSFSHEENLDLVDFPPISTCLYEKLGNVTASAFIDDELVCDPVSTPEQLLIPSSNGLKLLDLFPKHDEVEDDFSAEGEHSSGRSTKNNLRSFRDNTLRRFLSSASDDSDSDWEEDHNRNTTVTRKMKKPLSVLRRRRHHRRKNHTSSSFKGTHKDTHDTIEIQFEDPTWWRYLPSLKCIGLSCLILEEKKKSKESYSPNSSKKLNPKTRGDNRFRYFHGQAESALVSEICRFTSQNHLSLLSQCIGFNLDPNVIGSKGDISPFEERKRIHVVATRLLQDRTKLDRHDFGVQELRQWGLLRPDSTSMLIKDNRSGAHQLLTLGDARVVTDFCSDSWQGGISTITPLGSSDRKEILENNRNWSLADLDVTAFSYAPIPTSHEQKFGINSETYLVDNRSNTEISASIQKEVGSEDWSLLKNQIFLGLLGSSVSPRKGLAQIIEDSDSAGVRFVYFSSRNMRRTKEVASEMGIDVAWNCAISLRPMDDNEDDEDRINAYGEADINARLPHGVEAIVRHLEVVDNVPLLVRLYTDVTKASTAEMIHIFREHNDTVLTVGVSHISRNNEIFSTSSLSIGIDVLSKEDANDQLHHSGTTRASSSVNDAHLFTHRLSPKEVSIISSIAANSCVFNMPLDHGLAHLSSLIAKGRAALNAGTAAAGFMIVAYTSFSLLILMCPFSISTSIPFIPGMGSILYLLLVVPLVGIAMGFTELDKDSMTVVPMKNDISVSFARGERKRLFMYVVLKALLPAAMSQIIYLIAFGSLIVEYDSNLIVDQCGLLKFSWVNVIHCDILRSYAGAATISSGAIVIAFQSICIIVISASFLLGTTPVYSKPMPLGKNNVWVLTTIFSILIIILYLCLTLEFSVWQSLPWYFYFLSLISPFICLAVCELVKTREMKEEQRAAKMRRLHFETRLGMWSPK